MEDFKVTVQDQEVNVKKVVDFVGRVISKDLQIESIDVKKDKRINVECKPFDQKDLGVFAFAVTICRLETFTSSVFKDEKTEDLIWLSTWCLRFPGNGMNICEVEYNLTKDSMEVIVYFKGVKMNGRALFREFAQSLGAEAKEFIEIEKDPYGYGSEFLITKGNSVKYKLIKRFKFLHNNINLFNWKLASLEETNITFATKLKNLEGKLPMDLLLAWEKSVEAREELNGMLKKYDIGGLF